MKKLKTYDELNEDDKKYLSKEDKLYMKSIIAMLNETLKPGKDKGSSQAIVDTKDFEKAAEEIVLFFKPLMKT